MARMLGWQTIHHYLPSQSFLGQQEKTVENWQMLDASDHPGDDQVVLMEFEIL
jgi:hypothetical protein